ncbi:MAG: hypothetical protein IIW63_00435 [Clostridia bacterium]|nr:hypothetical protein [Clostridia bacterium]
MKFKKSISFVLTLCMVLSLFATFVIPVAAEDELPEGAAGIDYLGYIHDAYSMVAYAEADMTLGALVNKYLGQSKDLNYCKVAVCDADGTVKAVYLTLGRPDGVKTDFTISAGQFAVIYNANKTGHEVMDSINVGDTITLYNVDALKTHTGTAVALTNAGFTVKAAPKAGLEGENVSRWEAGAEFAVLTDGDNGVGEVDNYDPFQPRLFGVASGVMEATDYTLTFVIDKAEFNTITLYALDFANGGVMLPEAVTFVVDGVKYEAAINANANGIATIVATLDEAVTANCVVAEVTMGASPYSFTIFNMFTEFEVSLEEAVVEPGIEIVLPEGTGITIPDGYGATDILLDGYTGVGEITAHDGNHDKLVCLRNGTTDVESEYSLKVTLDKETAFNVVTLYILSHTGGNVGLPKAVTVNINGVDYEAAIAGEDASVVAIEVKLEEAVSATGFTVDVVMNSGSVKYNMYSEIAVSLVEEDDESYKDTYTHVDGVNVGTIQQLGDAWADKLTLDFWYLVEDGETTVTVNYAVDNKVVLDDDTMFRVWVDADITDTARTTLYDYKVSAGEAYNAKHASSINEAIVSAEYTVVGNDYFFTLVLDKATLGIDGEYRLNLQLGQSNSTTMHSIKYDNVTGEGATYAPWNTTEFYEVFGKAPEAPVTSQVVTDWNVSDWSTSENGANGAYLFTDQEAYLACTHTWWSHISFKPTTIAGVYEVAAIRGATGEAASFEIAEGGFVLAAHDTAAAGTAGAYVHALIKSLAVGDRVIFNGLNIADLTTTADATAVLVPTAEDMDLLVSHNYNYNWHCFEGQIITMAVGEAGLKKAGDAPNMTAEDTDILYIVELVDGAYKVTGVVGGKALLDVEIPENGFLYYVTANCTGYDKICHGELVGMYLVLGEIDLATKFAIDTQKGNPAKVMKAVSSFKTGDADLDGKITATDYAIVRKLVLGTLTAEDVGELAYKAADVNGNGKVDARDYYLVKRAFLGTYVIPGWEAEDAE